MKLFKKLALIAVGAVMAIGSGITAVSLTNNSGPRNVNAAGITAASTVAELATANSWANGTAYTSWSLDGVITVSTTGTGNNGKYYSSGLGTWRIYQVGSGNVQISASSGYTISSITLVFTVAKTGQLSGVTSSTAFNVGAESWSCAVSNSGTVTNGNVQISSFSVTYASSGLSVNSIAVTGTPATQYIGYVFDATGLTVTATWSDASITDVTSTCTWSITSALTSTDTSIHAIYAEKNSANLTIAPIAETAAPAITDSDVATVSALTEGDNSKLYRFSGTVVSLNTTNTTGVFYVSDGTNQMCVFGAESSSSCLTWDGRAGKIGYTFAKSYSFVTTYISTNALEENDTVTFVGFVIKYNTTMEFNGYIESIVKNTSTLVTSISVTADSKNLAVDATLQLTASVLPATAVDQTVTWSSGNSSVASVDSTGLVTGVAEGKAIITATAHDGSGVAGTYTVYVLASLASTYEKVTSVDSLISYAKVIIATADGGKTLGTTQNGNNRTSVASTVSETTLTPNASAAPLTVGINTTVVSGSTLYTFYDPANGGYLYSPSTSNYLRTSASLFHNVGGASSYWSISMDASNNQVTITNAGTSKIIDANSSSALVSCYNAASVGVYFWIDETNSIAAAAANSYASGFLSSMRTACDVTGATYDDRDVGQAWSSLESSYSLLSSAAKTIIINASSVANSANDVEAMLYSYDYICGKYGPNGTNDLTDFLSRNPAGSKAVNPFENTNSSMLIVLFVSMTSLVTLGGFFLLKKKKEAK